MTSGGASFNTQGDRLAVDCHVLHVINSLALGGAERLLSDLLPLVQRRGVKNSVLALTKEGDAFSSILEAAGIDVIFADAADGFSDRVKTSSAATRQVDSKKWIFSPFRIIDIAKTIKRMNPDIVQSHLAPSFHWCAFASFFRRGPIYITTEHASENHRMSKPFLRGFEKICYSRYKTIVCVSGSVARAMGEWLDLPAAKLPVISNGIQAARFTEKREPALDVVAALAGRTGIAMTARLVPAKDHATALRAMVLLPERYVLVLLGDGPEKPTMETLARDLGIERRCLFLGSRTDVPEVLAACGLYLQSSVKEGFGIAVLEAMASGLPVVATDVAGLSELVRGAGALVPPGDFEAMAPAVLEFENESVKKAVKHAAIERVARYSIEQSADAYVALYRRLRSEAENERARYNPSERVIHE